MNPPMTIWPVRNRCHRTTPSLLSHRNERSRKLAMVSSLSGAPYPRLVMIVSVGRQSSVHVACRLGSSLPCFYAACFVCRKNSFGFLKTVGNYRHFSGSAKAVNRSCRLSASNAIIGFGLRCFFGVSLIKAHHTKQKKSTSPLPQVRRLMAGKPTCLCTS